MNKTVTVSGLAACAYGIYVTNDIAFYLLAGFITGSALSDIWFWNKDR